jgi:glycosyltransferase involved in cell wall biosynthesis
LGRSISWWFYKQALSKLEDPVGACDAVLSTWLYPDGVAATRLAFSLNIPSWIMVLGSDAFHLDNAARRRTILDACAKAEGLICVSQNLADRLIDVGVAEEKVHVVPNGVDGELFRNRSRKQALEELAEVDGGERLRESKVCATNLRQGYGGQAGASACGGESQKSKVCLFVGNLVRVKGPDVLLRAWQLLRQRTDDRGPRDKHGAGRRTEDAVPRHSDTPILVVIGEGRMRRKLQKQARRLGIADSVMFLGGRPHDEIALWMNVADCLCLTSRSEGMPNVVVEALASGLPVVATDVGACNDLLKDEPYAQVVPAGDVEAFASAASKVLAIDADRECMAQRHMDTFSWDKQARRILELMSQEQP